MSWENVGRSNNWGYEQYFLGEPAKSASGTWADDPGVPLLVNGVVHKILWPDGTTNRRKVLVKSVYSNGNTKVNVPYIILNHRGAKIEVCLFGIGIKIWRDDP